MMNGRHLPAGQGVQPDMGNMGRRRQFTHQHPHQQYGPQMYNNGYMQGYNANFYPQPLPLQYHNTAIPQQYGAYAPYGRSTPPSMQAYAHGPIPQQPFVRPQPSPAVSAPYQPPPPQTPSSTQSSHTILVAMTPPTPQRTLSLPPASPPRLTEVIPFRAPLPWFSMPEQPWPTRRTRRKKKPTPQLSADAVELPNIPGSGSTDELTSTDTSVLPETPLTSHPPSEHESTNPTTPSSVQKCSTILPPGNATPTASKITQKPAAVSIIPAIPKTLPRDIQPTSQSSEEPAAKLAVVTEPTNEISKTDVTDKPSSEELKPAPPPPKAWDTPKSWTGLFNHATTPVGTNGKSPAATNFAKNNSESLAEALRSFNAVAKPAKVSFLEPRGLVNTGNMCYMNSVLQVLVFCNPFYNFLDQVGKRAAHSFKSSTPLIDAMIMFMREYPIIDTAKSVEQLRLRLKDGELEQYGEAFTPDFVYDVMRRLPRFVTMQRGHQQDAEEFLGFLLEGLHDECVQIMRGSASNTPSATATPRPSSPISGEVNGIESVDKNGWLEVGPKQKAAVTRSSGTIITGSPITKIFGGNLRSELRVPGLKDSVTLEPYQPLQLDIGATNVSNIIDALKGLTRSEALHGDFSSPKGPNVTATKQVFIETVPSVLILHLKRFQYDNTGGTQKIWKKVGYPLELELPKEVFNRSKRNQYAIEGLPKYRLIAVVYHHGKNASGGHYTVDVRRQDDREWIRLDDTVIRRVKSEDVAAAGSEEDPKVLAAAADAHKKDTATGNMFSTIEDQNEETEDEGWKQASGPGKKWSSVVNGTSTTKSKAEKFSVMDNKIGTTAKMSERYSLRQTPKKTEQHPGLVETPGVRQLSRRKSQFVEDVDDSSATENTIKVASVQTQRRKSSAAEKENINGHTSNGSTNGQTTVSKPPSEKNLVDGCEDGTDPKIDRTGHFDFGGSVGVSCMMIGFPLLMYYMWIGATYYDGKFPTREEGQTFADFFEHLGGLVYEGAFPSLRAWKIYWVFVIFEGACYCLLPGVYTYGKPLAHEGGKQLKYYCSGLYSFYTTIVVATILHYSGVFPLYTLIDEFGPLMSVAICSGYLVSIVAYFSAIARGAQHRMSGYPLYDFFMGAELNPRLFGILDFKMFFEVRLPWYILLGLSCGTAARQFQQYGYVSAEVCFLVMAHFLYANACSKGEECIPTTWDIYYEKWGFMLIFWNLAGVPLSYCHCTIYLANHAPSDYHWNPYFLVLLYTSYLFMYWIWDTTNSQKNRFRAQERGGFLDRKSFPQLPWQTLQNPRIIKTDTGDSILADGWYGKARKIHYTCDLFFALTWGLITGFSSPFPWFYPVFFACMISHRAYRDIQKCKSKYGQSWVEYEKMVPYLFIPTYVTLGLPSAQFNQSRDANHRVFLKLHIRSLPSPLISPEKMAEIKIDKDLFQDRLSHFLSAWKTDKRSGDALFSGASSIVVLMGKTEESVNFQKNNALHFWLLGYEFPATLFLFTLDTFYIVTTAKKAKHLEPLKGGKVPLEVLVRGKDAEQNEKLFRKITDAIKAAGKTVGVLSKDTSTGPFIDEWKKVYGDISKDMEEVDISTAISSAALAVKDKNELIAMRNASKACIALMNPYFVEEMSNILDEEKKVKHSALANKVDSKLDDKKFWSNVQLPNKQKMSSDFDHSQIDWTHGPIIQSGGKFDLKMSAQVDDENLHAGIIIASMGLRYKSYCSMIARTYLVDPNKSQESNYKLLLQVHSLVMKEIRDGATVKDIYAKALGLVKAKKPDLEKHFLKNVGAGIGIETRDGTLILNGKNTRSLKDGMTLSVTTGFSDVENPNPQDKKSKIYSMVLSDTVRVTAAEPVVFTGDAPSDLDATSFFFKDDEEPEPTPKKAKRDSTVGAVAAKNITKTKLRAERTTQADEGAEAKRREHQKYLAEKKQKEGLARFAEATGDQNGTAVKKFKRFESYKRDNQFPGRVKDLAIVMDQKNSTVVLPIMGRPVPFHIQTIKNASKSDEGDYSFLRINFLSPGQGVGRKDDQPFEDASAHFVRSLTFRSHDGDRLADIATQIGNMKKDAAKREQEKKEMEDVVEQDKLIEIRNRRPAVMDNVFIRPAMDGKRVPGKVEIHQNGLRYQSPLRQEHRVDILFSNVKHLFFQPCQHELIVIIHVHLKDPILIGKKKTKDVQFYREATDIQFDETGNRKRKYRYGDEEEFEAEQEERRRRAELDRAFKQFAEKIAEAGKNENVDVDVPFRELGFNGVPYRSNVFCQPSTDCLVQLTEPPFMVITLEDIEIAHLERVQFGLKNFDMVFVFKDFNRAPYHINTIPVESLENVKEWLDSVNLPFSEGPLNLNWPTIMKTVTADTHQFFVDGGWSFLATETDAEDDDEESDESAFEMSDSELAASEASSEDDSDFDSNASAEASDDASEDDASEGEDWDELEKKAKRKDREGGLDDEEAPKKKRKH